jgi:hypothetical protein
VFWEINIAYFAASFHFPLEMPNVLPQLKPSQPHLKNSNEWGIFTLTNGFHLLIALDMSLYEHVINQGMQILCSTSNKHQVISFC